MSFALNIFIILSKSWLSFTQSLRRQEKVNDKPKVFLLHTQSFTFHIYITIDKSQLFVYIWQHLSNTFIHTSNLDFYKYAVICLKCSQFNLQKVIVTVQKSLWNKISSIYEFIFKLIVLWVRSIPFLHSIWSFLSSKPDMK
jgi:hypothetical protein